MAFCYLLCVTSGSSIDRHSNNVSLFGLVEQVNLRPGAPPPRSGVLPLEVHAYFHLAPDEQELQFEMRLVLVATTGLETFGEIYRNRTRGSRFRVRALGVPYPPVPGEYVIRVDFRFGGEGQAGQWERQSASWPLHLAQSEPRPRVTH